MSIEFSDASQPSHLLLPPSPPALILSKYQGLFQEAEALQIRWPKYWNFSSSTSRSSDYSGFISFRIDYSDLVVQGALKSLQHHSSKASIVQHSAFFMVQLSYLHMTTGKNIAFDYTKYVSKVAQTVKHLPTMRETQVQSLGWEHLLEKEIVTYSNTLAWKIPWTEKHGRLLQSMGSQRRHN